MDTMPPVQVSSVRRSSHSRLKGIAVVTIILAGLVTIVEFGIPYLKQAEHTLAVSVGATPSGVLFTINKDTGSLVPLTVTVDGNPLPALDALKAADGSWYYILSEPSENLVGNLYVKKSNGSITKLTTSTTAKYNLSYDSVSGKLAYQELDYTDTEDLRTNQQWSLVVYDPSVSSGTVVGKGMNPVLIGGGGALLYKSGDGLELITLSSGSAAPVISLQNNAPYAFSTQSNKLAVYNPTTLQIDTYSLINGASPSYESSVDASLIPNVLAYVDGQLLAGYSGKDTAAKKDIFLFSNPMLSNLNPLRVTALPNALPQRVYTYE